MSRHNNFSIVEMRDILCVYAEENYSYRARRYEQMYPNRVQLNHQIFRNTFSRLGESG